MEKQDLKTGDLIAFRIGEYPDFSAPNKNSWGVLKILDLGAPTSGSLLSFCQVRSVDGKADKMASISCACIDRKKVPQAWQ